MSRSVNEVQCSDCGKQVIRGQTAYNFQNNPYCRLCLCGSCAEPFAGGRYYSASDAQNYCTMCVCYKCSSPITGNYVPKNDRKCCMKCCCRICRFPLETYEAPPNCIKCRCFKCSGILGEQYFKGNGNRYCETCGDLLNRGLTSSQQLQSSLLPNSVFAAPSYHDDDENSNDDINNNNVNNPTYNNPPSYNNGPSFDNTPSYDNGSSYNNPPSYESPSYNNTQRNGFDQNNNPSDTQNSSSLYYNVNMNRNNQSNAPVVKGVQHVCGFCKSNIQGIHMECDDIRYHVKCFVCANCGVEATRMINDQPYCTNCKPDSSRCNVCKQLLRGAGIEASGKYYHEECFTCTHCRSVIDGVRFKELFGRVILCSNCANNDQILENIRPY